MLTDLLVIDGRMGRARYMRLTLLAFTLLSFGTVLLVVPWAMSRQHGIELMPLGISAFFALAMLAFGLWIAVASSIRRMHDMGWSALWLMACIVPVEAIAVTAMIVLSIAMSLVRGTNGANVYGSDPSAA